MKINNINYSQNFGLKKTGNYNLIEKSLIKSGQNKMVNLVPHAKLEYSHELKKFLLATENDIFVVGDVSKYDNNSVNSNPFTVLANLYENLKKFDNDGPGGFSPLKTEKLHK